MTPRRILVTGGAGFIGSHLVNKLIEVHHNVVVLDDLSTGSRENVNDLATLIVGSITDGGLLGDIVAEVDACLHFAAIASVRRCALAWRDSHQVNQTGFINLLECLAHRPGGPIPVVYASSAAVYGNAAAVPICEASAGRPISCYGADKLGCELHARAAGLSARVPTFGLRLFNVYGPTRAPLSPDAGVVGVFAECLLRGEPLRIYGDGTQSRDFIHLDDVVAYALAALPRAAADGPVCNIASGRETTILHLAATLSTVLNRRATLVFADAREGDIGRSVADISLAKRMLRYEPRVGLRAGFETLLS